MAANEEKNAIQGGTLYLVATPIGNLADLSERAVKVLSEVDFVAAEDTRNSAKLLSILGISKPMVSYYEQNKKMRGEQILERLRAGESCALVTDAGTPAISDPGEDVARLCADNGIPVTAIPGPCAAIDALILSGLPTARFSFEGFLPMEHAERRERLAELTDERHTMIFHEAPHKLRRTLDDFMTVFGAERRISLCRELTKTHEEIIRTTVGDAVERYKESEPRGEYVLVVEGRTKAAGAAVAADNAPVTEQVLALEAAGMTRNEAVKAVAHKLGVPKNDVYQQMLRADI